MHFRKTNGSKNAPSGGLPCRIVSGEAEGKGTRLRQTLPNAEEPGVHDREEPVLDEFSVIVSEALADHRLNPTDVSCQFWVGRKELF